MRRQLGRGTKGEIDNVDTDHHLGLGFRRWRRILRPHSLGLWRRCGNRIGNYSADSPDSLPAGGPSLRARRPIAQIGLTCSLPFPVQPWPTFGFAGRRSAQMDSSRVFTCSPGQVNGRLGGVIGEGRYTTRHYALPRARATGGIADAAGGVQHETGLSGPTCRRSVPKQVPQFFDLPTASFFSRSICSR